MTDPTTLATAALVVAFASMLQQATGFGFALAATPLLALTVDAHAAVVLALMIGFLGTAWQAVDGRRACVWPVARRMLLGASVGMVAGVVLFRLADARTLQLLIGVAGLAAVAVLARGINLQHAGRRLDYGSGLLSGALTTSVGTNGPPLVFTLTARHFPPAAFRATLTTIFTLLDLISIAVFTVVGAITPDILVVLGWTLPSVVIGGALGVRLRPHLPPERFRKVTLALLTATALAALIPALLGRAGAA
ncbi:TSUP family transporter [Nocardioides ginsengisoli]|uniref:Probable membrane transporter protein n=1 Tax=Nocardioides ginsengisoli TaxID=363868 RepID=A0ABW3VTG4_9ACTN